MSASKRQSNGRSPLVNPQRQITSFFSKTTSPSPPPAPTISKLNPNKSKPNPNPSSDRSPSPVTPSPQNIKSNKPRLVIGQTASPTPPSTPAAAKSYKEEVVEKRIRVYWPLDKAWYEGFVKSFDKESNKHLVQYEDGKEELFDLAKEKIEWIQESANGFKRQRRGSSVAFKKVVIEDDEEMENAEENGDDKSDSSGDDWNKNVEKEQMSEDEEVDLVVEDEQKLLKGKKWKSSGGAKKSKSGGNAAKTGFKVPVMESMKNGGLFSVL